MGEVTKLESGEESDATLEATIKPPEDMTEDKFDQLMLDAAENHDLGQYDYNVQGPNSNTVVDNVVESTGAEMPDVSGATAQNHGEER